jgi:hypothetical protein
MSAHAVMMKRRADLRTPFAKRDAILTNEP